MKSKIIVKEDTGVTISDHTARQIANMAEKFFSNENNVKRFEKWHMEKYGCLPGEKKPVGKVI